MALNRTGVTHASGSPVVSSGFGGGITGQAGENGLSEGTKNLGAVVNTLSTLLVFIG